MKRWTFLQNPRKQGKSYHYLHVDMIVELNVLSNFDFKENSFLKVFLFSGQKRSK